jgi:hypothetical protein
MISNILNFLHLVFIFIPVIIYFLPVKYLRSIFKYILLIFILTPIHWVFFEDQCIFTIFTKKFDKSDNTVTSSGFSEGYMEWFYKPITELLGLNWNKKGISKVVNLHYVINFILLWYYLFYVGGCELI